MNKGIYLTQWQPVKSDNPSIYLGFQSENCAYLCSVIIHQQGYTRINMPHCLVQHFAPLLGCYVIGADWDHYTTW